MTTIYVPFSSSCKEGGAGELFLGGGGSEGGRSGKKKRGEEYEGGKEGREKRGGGKRAERRKKKRKEKKRKERPHSWTKKPENQRTACFFSFQFTPVSQTHSAGPARQSHAPPSARLPRPTRG